jgi:hypothetical protein
MRRIAFPLAAMVASLCAGIALAKLAPPSDEEKAKAAQTAAKNAWTEKVNAFKLCKSMDKVAAAYYADAKKNGKQVKPPVTTPPCADPGPFAAATPPATPTPHADGTT